ncbi:Surfeit locus protein 4-like protein [Fragariocoptes setiger]|uniref:Surfeit locus protein 4-like protein n=1 Tax=Fragariocoptes setiger TaxID=1670756 RepID=A0ABQ7S5U5_9ACAR|nr:Surfeit locus protein 4-like protein [Fragariocoptes setiger]
MVLSSVANRESPSSGTSASSRRKSSSTSAVNLESLESKLGSGSIRGHSHQTRSVRALTTSTTPVSGPPIDSSASLSLSSSQSQSTSSQYSIDSTVTSSSTSSSSSLTSLNNKSSVKSYQQEHKQETKDNCTKLMFPTGTPPINRTRILSPTTTTTTTTASNLTCRALTRLSSRRSRFGTERSSTSAGQAHALKAGHHAGSTESQLFALADADHKMKIQFQITTIPGGHEEMPVTPTIAAASSGDSSATRQSPMLGARRVTATFATSPLQMTTTTATTSDKPTTTAKGAKETRDASHRSLSETSTVTTLASSGSTSSSSSSSSCASDSLICSEVSQMSEHVPLHTHHHDQPVLPILRPAQSINTSSAPAQPHTNEPELIYYKRDGQRFGHEFTLKLSVDRNYRCMLKIRPVCPLVSISIQGHHVKFHDCSSGFGSTQTLTSIGGGSDDANITSSSGNNNNNNATTTSWPSASTRASPMAQRAQRATSQTIQNSIARHYMLTKHFSLQSNSLLNNSNNRLIYVFDWSASRFEVNKNKARTEIHMTLKFANGHQVVLPLQVKFYYSDCRQHLNWASYQDTLFVRQSRLHIMDPVTSLINSVIPPAYTDRAEEHAERLLTKTRSVLPTIGRLFLVSTFIEDGVRMWSQWADQRDYIAYHWNLPVFLGTLFVIYNLLAQLSASGMVLVRFRVRVACAILLSVVVIQTLSYSVLWTPNFFFRNISLCGALALLLAETFEGARRNLFAGVPTLENRKPQNYIQLIGRTFLVGMFLTIQRWEFSFFYVIETLFACLLMFLVTIGYRTRASALALSIYLLIMNFWINAFWRLDARDHYRDLYKYDFFQTLSIVGGLIMLICLGPGAVSIDDRRKW